jgi:hypothetical protein
MALGSTQRLREMSTRNLPGGKRRPARKADNLTAIYVPIVQKMWKPRRLRTLWAPMAGYRNTGIALPFVFLLPFMVLSRIQPNSTNKFILAL